MLKKLMIISCLLSSFSVMASYKLSQNGKAVTCYGADNSVVLLNAKRTTIKLSSEGESNGPKKIVKTITDNSTYVSYRTSEGTLVLSNKANTFQNIDGSEADAEILDCK